MEKSYINKRTALSSFKQKIRSNILAKTMHETLGRTNKKIRILEYGPGYGDLAISLLAKFSVETYTFVDFSNQNLEYIKNILSNKVESAYYHHDANNSFANDYNISNHYDIVISSHVIEHLRSPSSHLIDIRNLLSINGVGMLSTPNLDSLDSIKLGNDWRGHKDETHISLMGFDMLNSLIIDNKLKPIKHGTSPNSIKEVIYQKKLESIFFSKFCIGDSSNFIFNK
jgi:2-polyprenyl-3-methyl-5-hydroxy-6-metoxy-1,4-benzoquinol methylase